MKLDNAQYIFWKTVELIIYQEEVSRAFYKFIGARRKYNCPCPRREGV
jgi:hypothetical protein